MKPRCKVFPTFELLGKTWTLHIIKELSWHSKKRYSELKRTLEGVSPKTLTERPRELEAEGVINRIVYPDVPLRVEYDLSEKGEDLSKSIDSICDWARKWYPDEVPKA